MTTTPPTCHYREMTVTGGAGHRAALGGAAVAVVIPVSAMVGLLVSDQRLAELGRADLSHQPGAFVYFVAIVSSTVVGAVLIVRRSTNPAGWCFAALGSCMAVAGPLDNYAAIGAVADRGSLPAADVAAVLGGASFIPWLVLVALALYLTPTGRALTPRWRRAQWATVIAGTVWAVAKLLSDARLDKPFAQVRNPMAITTGSGVIEVAATVAGLITGVGLLAAGASLLVRFRRASGVERRQLRWLALVVIPLPLFVALSFLGAGSGHRLLVTVSTGGFVALVPLAAGLAIAQYHLYDVDRILSRAVSYVLLTALVVAVYVGTVLVFGFPLGRLAPSDRSAFSATLAALVAVAVAGPARRRLQDAVDRRFSRRRFDAVTRVRAHVTAPRPGVEVDAVLREALGDSTLVVAYWIAPRAQWATAAGLAPGPAGGEDLVVSRHDEPVARLRYDPRKSAADLVTAVAQVALPELVSTGLRSALALELVEVQASRSRIATAQLKERQRIERDLHDGAQQRLLALAMQLNAALLNGDTARLREAARAGVDEAQATVRELRELASGLHPAVLTDGGLAAAVDGLAARLPGTLMTDVPEQRYAPAVEGTAWFIVCEAVTNAMKHAAARHVRVQVEQHDEELLVQVTDDGSGGADLDGQGLRGLADRAAAVGGRIDVRSDATGTTVRAALPCAS